MSRHSCVAAVVDSAQCGPQRAGDDARAPAVSLTTSDFFSKQECVHASSCGGGCLSPWSQVCGAIGGTGRPAAETEAWRAQREQDLTSETGWLTVAGLVFLRPGVNTVGSDRDNDVVLPTTAPAHAGRFVREGPSV